MWKVINKILLSETKGPIYIYTSKFDSNSIRLKKSILYEKNNQFSLKQKLLCYKIYNNFIYTYIVSSTVLKMSQYSKEKNSVLK